MDFEAFSDLNFLGSSGVVVSVEQKAALQSSLVILRKEHKFRRVKLWGVIKGVQKDYFIVFGVGKNEMLEKRALYSQDCVQWHLLPHADSAMKSKSALLRGRFTGDPSFNYEHNVTQRVGEGENVEEETSAIEMKEEERLAAVVATIDEEVAVIPRGAYVKGPLGEVVTNKSFKGLPLEEANQLKYYFHFRVSTVSVVDNVVTDKNLNSITRSIDFLDNLEKDIPNGCWSIQCDQGVSMVLRSLSWLGMTAYHVPNTPTYGYFYCGTGEKNPDLPFML